MRDAAVHARRGSAGLVIALAFALGGCFGGGGVRPGDDGFPDADVIPANVGDTPDAIPREEPRSKYGNPPEYEVLGEHYFVLNSAKGYKERGRASWYGTKFNGQRTSSGETYDMFGMTAAHKTLPLPTYVRVTNLANGKNVVVKVNDRGPFHKGRIIDLSYAAAVRLGILGEGSADVEVEALDASAPQPPASPALFIEVGSTDDPIYAVALREEVGDLKLGAVEIRSEEHPDAVTHRVLVGPFRDRAALDEAAARLKPGHPEARIVGE